MKQKAQQFTLFFLTVAREMTVKPIVLFKFKYKFNTKQFKANKEVNNTLGLRKLQLCMQYFLYKKIKINMLN